MTIERATDVYAEPNPMRRGTNRRQVHKWIERPGGVVADEERVESKLFGQPGSRQKLPCRIGRRVDRKHLHSKTRLILELTCPGCLLPVHRVDHTSLGSASAVAAASANMRLATITQRWRRQSHV